MTGQRKIFESKTRKSSGRKVFCVDETFADYVDESFTEGDSLSPHHGGRVFYPKSLANNAPPVTFVIPPGNDDFYRRSTRFSKSQRNDKFADRMIRAQDTESSEGTVETSYGRFNWTILIWIVAIAIGSFGAGIGVTWVVSRQRSEEPIDNTNGGGNTINNTKQTNSSSTLLVGAYYYPWHGQNFHNGDGYIRKKLNPVQFPTLGEYDDSKPETISQHLEWSRQANIGLWVTSWWGPHRLEDSTTKNIILEHKQLGNMKIALHYESTGRVENGNITNVQSDLLYISDNYFSHANYYKVDGRPVIFVYVTRTLEEMGWLEETILTMRSTANKRGHNIFIVGDHVFQDAPIVNNGQLFKPFLYFDAVTNFDFYGSLQSINYYAGHLLLTDYFEEQKKWQEMAREYGCRYIPTVSPGFNDRGVRLEADHQPLSRRLTPDSAEGSLFVSAIQQARQLVDPKIDNLLLVNSFNEWHEDTQIEPCSGPMADSPTNLTGGLEYVGYGELYLNILREETRVENGSYSKNIFSRDES